MVFKYPIDMNFSLSKIEIEFCDLSNPDKKVFIETVLEEKQKA